MTRPITFQALIGAIATMKDGGWKVTLELGDNEREAVMALSEHRTGQVGVAIVPVGDGTPHVPDVVEWAEDDQV